MRYVEHSERGEEFGVNSVGVSIDGARARVKVLFQT